jgi:signal transduction histidine kinase
VGKGTKSGVDYHTLDLQSLSRQVTERSALPMAAMEGSTHIVRYVNPAFCRLVSRESKELLGVPFARAVPEAEECLPHLDRAYHTEEAETGVVKVHFAPHPLHWSYAIWAVPDASNHPVGVMIQVTDTTKAELFRQNVTAMNQELLLASLRQHELTEAAKKLNAELQQAYDKAVEESRERKRLNEQLRHAQERLRHLSTYLQRVREGERTSLSRELHDELGQVLTGIKMDVAWIGRRVPEGSTMIVERVHALLTLIDTAILSVQRISMALRPPALDDFGLQEALQLATEDFEKRTTIVCKLLSKPQNILLKKEIATEAFRIFQEALTNIGRHALAQKVTVSLHHAGDRFSMEVSDDGRGITEKEIRDPKSIGLTGMRERAFALGGTLTITGTRGEGTTITLSVPLNEGKEEPEILKRRRKKQPAKG